MEGGGAHWALNTQVHINHIWIQRLLRAHECTTYIEIDLIHTYVLVTRTNVQLVWVQVECALSSELCVLQHLSDESCGLLGRQFRLYQRLVNGKTTDLRKKNGAHFSIYSGTSLVASL